MAGEESIKIEMFGARISFSQFEEDIEEEAYRYALTLVKLSKEGNLTKNKEEDTNVDSVKRLVVKWLEDKEYQDIEYFVEKRSFKHLINWDKV